MSIIFNQVSYTYTKFGADVHQALKTISLDIPENSFIGVVGHTGSGKSTLVQLASGLIKPTQGSVMVDGVNINETGPTAKNIRRSVGLVFQYPEHQLFEETIAKDVAFGPKNLSLSDEEIQLRVEEALNLVGLKYEQYKDQSPFELSGGQKRRVAIAGVLAMKPKYLILDEPTAGLDPLGRDTFLESIASLQKKQGMTIILVSHSMDDVARFADRLVVMNQGNIVYDQAPVEVFKNYQQLCSIGLGVPRVTEFLHELHQKGLKVDTTAITIDGAKQAILKALKERELGD